jgi:replication-associated recombination protein RarA
MPVNWRIILDLQRMGTLAERMHKIRDYISQSHLVGQMALWRNKSLKNYSFHNFLGSTQLAKPHYKLLHKNRNVILSAINSGVKDIRDVIDETKWWFIHCKILFFYRWDSPF